MPQAQRRQRLQNRNRSYAEYFLYVTGAASVLAFIYMVFSWAQQSNLSQENQRKLKALEAQIGQHIKEEDFKALLTDFTQLTQLDPHSHYDNYISLAGVQYTLGMYKESIKSMDDAMARVPSGLLQKREQIYRQRGSAKKSLGIKLLEAYDKNKNDEGKRLLAEAGKDFDTAMKLDPSSSEVYALRGSLKYFQGDSIEDVVKEYEKSISIDKSVLENKSASHEEKLEASMRISNNYIFLGNTLGKIGRVTEAIDCFQKAMKFDSSAAGVHRKNAQEHIQYYRQNKHYQDYYKSILDAMRRNNWQIAINYCDLIIQAKDYVYPKLGDVYGLRGAAKEKLHLKSEAIKDFEEAIKVDPTDSIHHANKGLMNLELYYFKEAVEDFNHAIQLDPKNYQLYRNRAFACQQAGQLEKSREDYNKIIQEDPNVTDEDFFRRGITFKVLGKPQEAMEDFNRAIKMNPKSYTAYFQKAMLLKENDYLPHALENFNQAIQWGLDAIGMLPKLIGDVSSSDAAGFYGIKMLLSEYFAERGKVRAKMGLLQEAILDFDEALEGLNKVNQYQALYGGAVLIDAKNTMAHIYWLRGEAKRQLGQISDALLDYEQAIASDTEGGENQRNALREKANLDKTELKKRMDISATPVNLPQTARGGSDYQFVQMAYHLLQSVKNNPMPLLLTAGGTSSTTAVAAKVGFWPVVVGVTTGVAVSAGFVMLLLLMAQAKKRYCEVKEAATDNREARSFVV